MDFNGNSICNNIASKYEDDTVQQLVELFSATWYLSGAGNVPMSEIHRVCDEAAKECKAHKERMLLTGRDELKNQYKQELKSRLNSVLDPTVFSVTEYQKTYPFRDVNAAKAEAVRQGYRVVN